MSHSRSGRPDDPQIASHASSDTPARQPGSTSRRPEGSAGSEGGIAVVFDALRQKYRWRLNQPLGEGGFGYVFQEEVGGLWRAVKISKSPLKSQDEAETLPELRALSELGGHPRLLSLILYEVVAGHLVTVWELAQQTLEGYLHERQQQANSQGGLPLKQLVPWMLQVAEGIDFLNQHGVYHRDIKPRNLFLVQGHAKVGDLGLAKEALAGTMSHTGDASLGYAPPEALAGKLDKTIDLYGLVASYVRLRTGQEPFGPPQNMSEVLRRLEKGECQTEGMRAEEAAWVRQALHPDRKQRPTGGAVAWVRELARRLQAAARPQAAASGTPQPGVQSASAAPASLPPATSSAPPFPSRGVLLIEGDRREAVLRLDEAIGRATEGAEIRLAPGEHRLARPLKIQKSLTLVGPGPDQCRVTCAGEDFVIKYSGNGTFAARGIRFEHVGSELAHVLVIASGQIDLENCVCRGAVWDYERKISGVGLLAIGSAQGTVRNCRFEHNGLNGVELYGNAALTLEGNTCQQNVQWGIAFFGNSTGQVRNNVCRENGWGGIYAGEKSRPTLEANRCEGNKWHGILFRDNATGIARKNICTGNGRWAIFVEKTAKPELEENEGEGKVVYGK